MDKPFKSYDELIEKLRDKKLLIPNEDRAKNLLKKYSYFALISGYKDIFKAKPDDVTGERFYRIGTTIDDILALYQFDAQLRKIFLDMSLIVEIHMKSILSYSFVEINGDDQKQYLDVKNYNAVDPDSSIAAIKARAVKKLIGILNKLVTPPFDHEYIGHQWSKHKNIPLWVAVKALSFGQISKMYSLCPQKIQTRVSKEFRGVMRKDLQSMLALLTDIRNVCAHNERLYNIKVNPTHIAPDTKIHSLLGIKKNERGVYLQGKDDLFSAIICLKYLLPNADFLHSLHQIEEAIDDLCLATKQKQKKQILKLMGFPNTWEMIKSIVI